MKVLVSVLVVIANIFWVGVYAQTGISLGNLTRYHMVFTNGSIDANWQSASKGFAGDVVVNGLQASERTSGSFAYAGKIYTNASSLGAWQDIVNNNPSQASVIANQGTLVTGLINDLENAFSQINALPATAGYASISATSLNGMNTTDGIGKTYVFNITSGLNVSSQIVITGDKDDFFILRWDTDADFSNGYNGQVKFQSGGAIVPQGNLVPSNFIHVAGDINSSGGGSNPAAPYPQGPRTNDGTGSLIAGASNFSGGGFFTGYWLTTGSPTMTGSGQPFGKTSSLSNGIFVGGWYSKSCEFSMTSGTSGCYVSPPQVPATSSIGDFVFNDLNYNGIQNTGEGGIANVLVTLKDSYGNTKTTTTNATGYYQFTGLAAGTYRLEFSTPAGYIPSLNNQGSNPATDSDPLGGLVTVTLVNNQANNTVDAGFYRSKCTILQGTCGAGYLTYQTTAVKNGNFEGPITSPAPGNNFAGTANTAPAATFFFSGGQYKSQSDYRGTGYADQISGNQNAHSIITTTASGYTASYTGQEGVNQLPFPGDPARGVRATNSFMFWNGNQFAPEPTLVWEQTLSGLTIGKSYTFRFYATNLMEPISGTDNFVDPLLLVKFDGNSGSIDGSVVFPAAGASNPDYYQLTKAETANNTALNGWVRFEITFVASATTKTVKILDCARSCMGDALGLTGIALETCEKDTDGDCIPDIDDIDDDNDGITDLEESGGYDPLQDCDNDGIPNYKDAISGCAGLSWKDCNSDGINDVFDFDRDGIMNELDLDSDNDAVLDVQETRDPKVVDTNNDGMVDGADQDADGLLSTADANDLVQGGPGLTPEDMDKDGNPNYLDLDSDGDGVSDLTDATGLFDTDGLANGTDTDGDGVRGDYTLGVRNADTFNGFGGRGVVLLDTDGDGYANLYDIDSDDDGITDNVEAQPTCSYKEPTGIDNDKDGLDNAYDTDNNVCLLKAPGITPFDKDGDSTPDMFDLDTDNDGARDINEGSGRQGNFVTRTGDTDKDGLIDEFDVFNLATATGQYWRNVVHGNMGTDGSFDGTVPAGSNAGLPQSVSGNCGTGADRDWRNIYLLPVTLVQFKGNLANEKVSLAWTVANELNIAQYIVERSTDGMHFTPIGSVKAAGNANVTNYNYTDAVNTLVGTKVYYRLKIQEVNAGSKNSAVVSFTLTNKTGMHVSLYPNPARTTATVSIQAATSGGAMLKLTDMYGKTLYTRTVQVEAGTTALPLHQIATMPAGTYNIQVILNQTIMNERLIITR